MNDCVFTPGYVTDDLLDLNILNGCTSVLEPCAGDGAIVKAIRRQNFDWFIGAVEINNDFAEALYESNPDSVTIGSFLDDKITTTTHGTYDAIITNPPYSCLDPIIQKSYTFLNPSGKMAMLLRLQHLSGVKRAKLIEALPPTSIHMFGHRPAITNSVADIGGYCWVIWDKPLTTQATTIHWFKRRVAPRRDDRTFDSQKYRVFEHPSGRARGTVRGSLITAADIPFIRTSKLAPKDLAAQFRVCVSTISHIRKGDIWKNV